MGEQTNDDLHDHGPPVRVSVVIATLRRPESLAATLADLGRCLPPPHEILVVDGDAAESARPTCEQASATVRYLGSSPGLTRQRNLGAAATSGDVVLFIDDDVSVAPETFAVLAAVYTDPSVAGATARLVGDRSRVIKHNSPLRRYLPGGGRQGTFTRFGYPRYIFEVDRQHDVEHMPGCFMSARRELVLEIGFDEQLTGYALAEDEDFACRLAGAGCIRYIPELGVKHRTAHHEHSSRSLSRALVVNRTYLFRKNFACTPLARAEFAGLIALLAAHRLVARDLAGARGIAEGAVATAWKGLRWRRPALEVETPRAIPTAFISSHARDGGSEQHLDWVLTAIDRTWVRLVVSLEAGALPVRARALGYRTVVLPTGNRYADLVDSAWRLRRALIWNRPKVVHASGVKAATVAVLATWGTGIPVVWLKVDFSRDGWIARLVGRRCAQVVGVSSAVLGTFDRRRDGGRLRVVHNGVPTVAVDRDHGRTLALAPFGRRAPTSVITLVGRLDPDKGHEELLEVAPAVLGRLPNTGFLLVGGTDPGSPYAERLRHRVRALGLEESVRLLGYRPDVRELMSGCELLVHTSLPASVGADTEGFPLVALEAMMAGTPVVGYANGGLAELVGECGRLVPRGNRGALADAIVALLSDPDLWFQLSSRGRERVSSCFGMAANIAALQEAYRAALAANGTHAGAASDH